MAITEVTPEVLADLKAPHDTRLSPSGQYVVYALRSFFVRQKDSITASLWMAVIGKGDSSRQLTQGNYHDSSPQFSPDSKQISFLSDRGKPGKASALYLLPIDGGEALPLTDIEKEKSVADYKWSPCGKKIALSSQDEDSEQKKKRNENKDDAKVYGEDWDWSRLRVVDVETRKVTTVFDKDENVAGWEWSPSGKEIAFAAYKSPELDDVVAGGGVVRIIDAETKELRVICEFPAQVNNLTWHRMELFWTAGVPIASGSRVYHVSTTAETAEASHLAYGDNECCMGVRLCGDSVVAFVQEGLNDQLRLLQSDTFFSEEADISKGWDAVIEGGKATLVVTKATTSAPEEVFSIVGGKSCQLSVHNKEFASLNIGESCTMKCKAEDGYAVDGVLCTPKSLIGKSGPHATVVILHGGPYSRVTVGSDPFFWWPRWLLSLGYMVLMPNYRGSSGRGKDFAETVHGKIDASYDFVALVKQGINEGIIDEKKVAVGGWSQGGYLTYLSITRDSTFHFAAAIAGAGVTQWDTMAMTSDLPTFEKTLSGAAPWDGEPTDVKASPIYGVKNVKTPLLILHGENDERVPKEQAIGFHRGMKAYGKECEMVIYPREGHGLPVPFEKAHYIDMMKRIKAFLAKHLE